MIKSNINTVAVLGLGTMGHGIAQTFALAGFAVRCFDVDDKARSNVLDRVHANLHNMAAAGIVDEDRIAECLDRMVVCSTESDAFGPAQFVTEAISEDLAIKQEVFARLESMVEPETILASNSSSFPISQTAAHMKRPERAVVTHWFNPPHIVPVVEVVPGQNTSEQTVQSTCDLLERIGKQPVRINQEIPGFLVNRVQVAMFREIWDLLDRGIASAEDIDRAIRGSMGLRLAALGPLAIIDFAGLDITSRVYENLIQHMCSDKQLPEVVRKLVEDGHHGTKTGKGFFEYTPESLKEKQAERDRRYLELIRLLQCD